MNFNFIYDLNGLDTLQLGVMLYNLFLLYFMYDVAKWIINIVSAKLGKGRKRFR